MILGAEHVDNGGGVTTRPAEMLLTLRARDVLAAGPADPVSLIGTICGLTNAPRRVAEEMAIALFAGRREFQRGGDGRWFLSAGHPASPWAAVMGGGGARAPAPPIVGESLDGLAYAVVDVETTGGRPYSGDRITEIAIVVVRSGRVTEIFETLVNPERPIPPMITALTNISWSMVCDKPPFREICPQVLGALEGRVFVAHNAGFDWRFIASEVERATGRRMYGRRLCTVRLARRLLPELRRRSLDGVAYHYGVEIVSRHRAGGDARATADILLRLLRDAAGSGVRHWPELEALLARRAAGRRRRRRGPAMPHPVERDTTA